MNISTQIINTVKAPQNKFDLITNLINVNFDLDGACIIGFSEKVQITNATVFSKEINAIKESIIEFPSIDSAESDAKEAIEFLNELLGIIFATDHTATQTWFIEAE